MSGSNAVNRKRLVCLALCLVVATVGVVFLFLTAPAGNVAAGEARSASADETDLCHKMLWWHGHNERLDRSYFDLLEVQRSGEAPSYPERCAQRVQVD